MKTERILRPEFDGDYVHIYNPNGDVYRGNDTDGFKNGTYYEEWITNDFSVIKDNKQWHMIGITHPKPKNFVSAFDYEPNIHEAEYQLFHCTANADSFKDAFFKNSFLDNDKILYPQERVGEKPEIWAPHLMKYEGKFAVIYSPQEMRCVLSDNFKDWEKKPCLFRCNSSVARDPYIFCEDEKYYIIYTEAGALRYRVSEDMVKWTDEKILQETMFEGCEQESPFLMKKDGIYYLFWSICDGRNGSYDDRTFVFASKTLEGFANTAPITMLRAHAPEIVVDDDGDYYLLSVFYPNNGVSAVKLKWI